MSGKGDDIIKFILPILQSIIAGVAMYAASQISELSKSVNQLNVQIAVMIEQVSNQKNHIDQIDKRLQIIEIKK